MSRLYAKTLLLGGLRRPYSSAPHSSVKHGGYGWRETPELLQKVDHYAHFPATGVTLRQMVQFGTFPSDGTLFRASQFIVEELPIRFAHRVKDLENLPAHLSEMPSIKQVKEWYTQSFDELTSIPLPKLDAETKKHLYHPSSRPKLTIPVGGKRAKSDLGIKAELGAYNSANDKASIPNENSSFSSSGAAATNAANGDATNSGRTYFTPVSENYQWPSEVQQYNRDISQALQRIKARHDGVVSTVAQGVLEWKASKYYTTNNQEIQTFLDRFYMSRIGIRMLIGQHIAINMDRGMRDDYVGIICTNTNVKEIAQAAIDNARFICEDWYGLFEAPQVKLHCNSDHINFMYVPGHLNHIIFEIVKNSLRAVVESYGVDADEYPPVKVIIAQGDEDITIKISDEGGGIPRRAVEKVWTYMYTTAKETPQLDDVNGRSDFKAPLAGFGYGLPVSRLYARYFGGDLDLISMQGYGTDVYLHLNRLSTAAEPLQ